MTSFEDRPRWPNKKIIPKKNKKTKSEGIDYPKLKLKRMFLKLKKKRFEATYWKSTSAHNFKTTNSKTYFRKMLKLKEIYREGK